jgi:hypothetical protein
MSFESIILDLIDACVRAVDVLDGDCDAEPEEAILAPMRCNGVGRNAEWPKSLLFYFSSVPTDEQMRYLQKVMARAAACIPEDLR